MKIGFSIPCLVLLGLALIAGPVTAHHSYAMFDGSKTVTVSGTVAKFEWGNPHVYVWVYVANPAAKSGYDLYAFENGSPNVLASRGWSKTTFAAGDKVSIEYWPLKDGGNGGHFLSAKFPDGHIMRGAGGPRGVNGDEPPKLSTPSP